MIEIKKIIKQTSYGATKPIIILANDNKKYILKFRTSSEYEEEKDLHIFNEFLAYKLINCYNFSISPQKLKIINIDEMTIFLAEHSYKNKDISIDSLNFLKKSLGPNICVEYLENTEKALSHEINSKSFKNQLKHIDNIIINNDRDTTNTNILKDLTCQEKYYAIDYGLAILDNRIYEAIVNNKINKYIMHIQTCNATNSSFYILKKFPIEFKKLDIQNIKDKILEIIDSCPKEWEILKHKETVAEVITARINTKLIFENTKCPMELF